jgi:pentatricopeptide repeat protein
MVMAVVQIVADIVAGLKVEIGVFFLAVGLHLLLFGNHRFPSKTKTASFSKPKAAEKVPEALNTPTAILVNSLKPFLRSGLKAQAFETELKKAFGLLKVSGTEAEKLLVSVLESLGRSANDAELFGAVRSMFRSSAQNSRLAELLLNGYMALRLRSEFDSLVAELDAASQAEGSALPPVIAALVLQSELSLGNLEAAVKRLPAVAPAWSQNSSKALNQKQQYVMIQLSRLSIERNAVEMVVDELQKCSFVTPASLEPFFLEAVSTGNFKALDIVQKAAEKKSVALTPSSRCALLAGMALQGTSDAQVLKFYHTELSDVDVLTVHTKAGRLVAEVALRANDQKALKSLLKDCDDCRKVCLLKSFGVEGRVDEARCLFEACEEKTACLHNALLDATVNSGDSKAFGQILDDIHGAGVADVVTYNTMIKSHLQKGDVKAAHNVVETMRSSGVRPNVVTFNELIDTAVTSSQRNDFTWNLIEEMKNYGLKPNKVTCSILLKSLQAHSSAEDVERTIALLNQADGTMDEVLLSSVCEACIRTNRGDLLAQQLRRQKGPRAVQVQGAHTFGSLIRAFGFINDLEGIWSTWREMRSRNVVPTSITLGCMVEALVSNDEIEKGYQLIQELRKDEPTASLINAAIYGSILKGFGRQKLFNRVWNVYDEMVAANMQFTIVTFNSLIDVCARSGEMQRVQPLLEDMSNQGIEPNVITYSTVLKGYCSANRIDEAFELLEEMKKNKAICPDEVTYNTLLDGCARHGLYDRGLTVLAEMRAANVPPSNFTLSVLVKLASRSRKTSKAFELVRDLSKEFNLRLNIHVYNNLIQAAIAANDFRRALEVFEQLLSEKVKPDPRTYTLLLKATVSTKQVTDAIQLLRSACGLRGGHLCTSRATGLAQLRGGAASLASDVLTEVLAFIANSAGQDQTAMHLLWEISRQPGVKLDQKLRLRIASQTTAS